MEVIKCAWYKTQEVPFLGIIHKFAMVLLYPSKFPQKIIIEDNLHQIYHSVFTSKMFCFDLPKFAPFNSWPLPKLAPFCKQNTDNFPLFKARNICDLFCRHMQIFVNWWWWKRKLSRQNANKEDQSRTQKIFIFLKEG